MKKLMISFAIALCAVVMLSFNDVPQLDAILQKLATYNTKYPEEKVYIHVDKPFYRPGESIWFSFYALNGITHQPSVISSVAYVQLIDPKGNVIAQPELFMKDGVSYGDFKLEDKIAGGIYKLKAYTKWSLNFKNQKPFEKEIQVQTISTPRLLLKLDWEKEAYGPGDTAVANITARDLKDEKINRGTVNYKVFIEGREVIPSTKVYTIAGNAKVRFAIPANTNSSDGLLQAVVSYNGVEESISRSIPIVLNKVSLQFFPEGGDMINDQPTSVAFKALNEFGKAVDVEGEILKGNNVVAKFASYHMGMGAFELMPKKVQYIARITKPTGIKTTYSLPGAKSDGYTLSVKEQTSKQVTFSINSTITGAGLMVATVHGQVAWHKSIAIKTGSNHVQVETSGFPGGIAVFTLFDDLDKARCERLVYINKEKQLNIKLEPDKKTYRPGEKVDLDITTTDASGSPLPARLSLAVVDDQLLTFAGDKQDNILSWFMLSSEVKGDIQEPSFYFDDTEEKAAKALDYLLMTQGWRRFDWNNLSEEIKLVHVPEKEGTISGYTQLGGVRGKSEITLIEMGNRRRAKKITTRANGSFDFINADPTVSSLLIAKRPYKIFLTSGQPDSRMNGFVIPDQKRKSTERSEEFITTQAPAVEERPLAEPGDVITSDVTMGLDVTQLSEVVVTGYGVETRRDLTGSVVSIQSQPILPITNLEGILQGRVPGVQVSQSTGSAAQPANLTLRGIASTGNAVPLYVIDGIPMTGPLNGNFSPANMILPDNINSIEVNSTPEMVNLYGSRAANGVILITTKNAAAEVGRYTFNRRKARYNYIIVPLRKFTPGREFYVPPVVKKKTGDERTDFRTTVFWKQHIVTDRNGKASVSFTNNHNTSVFRLTAEGISANGLIGRNESTYSTQMPFSIDVKLPGFIGFEDTVKLPVRINNTTNKPVMATVTIDAPKGLTILPSKTIEVEAMPSMTTTAYVTVLAKSTAGTFPLTITTSSKEFNDEVKHNIEVHPVGFPVRQLWSSVDAEKTIEADIHNAEKGSIRGTFEAYPDLLGSLLSDAKSILREPHGCFEQTSASTFPNIMALQYMKKYNKIDPKVEALANKYIRDGYNRLMSYEIRTGGFEWFGKPAAHEGLSALGVMEFFEMQKVYAGVDPHVVDRTAAWLMSRRNGQGGFHHRPGLDGFGSPLVKALNAYIVYGLAATGQSGFEKEYYEALNEALASKDMYRMALVAIASHHLGKNDQYQVLIDRFKDHVEEVGLDGINAQASFTYSYGDALKNETIGYWIIAMSKDPGKNIAEMTRSVKYMLSRKFNYGYGNTQATVVSLQALCAFHDVANSQPGGNSISVSINNNEAQVASYSDNDVNAIRMEAFADKLSLDGKQPLHVKFSGTKAIPWQLELEWYSKRPDDCKSCKVDIQTTMNGSVKVNETIRLAAELKNTSDKRLPMAMVVIGIPAGLSVQPWQLKELQEKEVFDFYEIMGDRLAIYYRELAPSATIAINLDLKAEIPGSYRGAASTAYLYYGSECKQWAEGLPVVVNP